MSPRPRAVTGAPCWIDLATSDRDRSRDFYCTLFGWTADAPAEEFGGYLNFRSRDVLVAGCMTQMPDSPIPDLWSVYLASDDAAKTVDLATAHGAGVVVAPMPVADLGVMAVLTDPAGASVGVWQPGAHPGFGVVGEPGAPSWFELHTTDHAGAVEFYRQVFGGQTQTVSDTAEFRYTTLADGEEQYAGIYDATADLAGAPPHWEVYFGVEDTDAALATLVDLGGRVLRPAEDTPYGRMATVADPTGARFKIVTAGTQGS